MRIRNMDPSLSSCREDRNRSMKLITISYARWGWCDIMDETVTLWHNNILLRIFMSLWLVVVICKECYCCEWGNLIKRSTSTV